MNQSARSLLSINNYHYRRGGAEAVYFDHAAMFQEQGWQTAFFSMHHPENISCEQDRYFVNELELGQNYSVTQKLQMASKVVYSYEARAKLRSLLDVFRPDVAHVHSVYHHISPAILPLLKSREIPVVLTAHDLKLLCPAYTMLSQGEICERCKGGKISNVVRRKCIKDSAALSGLIWAEAALHGALQTYKNNVDIVVTPSQFYRQKFLEWGWADQQLRYIPNYVDASAYAPEYAAGDYFVYFGRLLRDKGVHTLIKATAAAGVRLVIAGTGPHAAEFEALAAASKAQVEFAGYCSGEKLHGLIRGARAVVLPSEWYENAPISILEAYALGKPVIGADIGGIPEMIEPNQSGWLFTSRSADDLAERLRQAMLAPQTELVEMGRAGRAIVEQRYTAAAYLHAMQNVYQQVGVSSQ